MKESLSYHFYQKMPTHLFSGPFSQESYQSKKVDGFPGPHFYSALSSRDARHVMPPHWSPLGWRLPRGDLAVNINASARGPGLSPGKGQAFKQSD